jgi:hypothetical protein
MIEPRITYNYAIIDETGWCYEVCTTSRNCDGMEGYITVPAYDTVYMDKYYNVADSKWYHDAEFQNEATELN